MKSWSRRYPWHQHMAGESFFVPCLDVVRVQAEGLRVGYKVLGKNALIQGQPGIHAGLLGVLFTVKQRRQRRDTFYPSSPADPQ